VGEGDEDGDGIAGQADEGRGLAVPSRRDHAHGHGPARLDGEPPEGEGADLFHRRLDVVLLAGGDAARGQDEIVPGRRLGGGRREAMRSSLRMPRSVTSAPSRRSSAWSMKRLES
jgi:hypothetical protein